MIATRFVRKQLDRGSVALLVATVLSCGSKKSVSTDATSVVDSTPGASAWKFVMVADTHVTTSGAPLADLVQAIATEHPSLVLVPGDIVQSGRGTTRTQMLEQLTMFHQVMQPLYDQGIPVYPVRGNHENDATDSISAWRASFVGSRALPANGPSGEEGLSYSFGFKNALFVGVDEYVAIHQVNQPWLDGVLATNELPHVFVFGHEPAFKYFHADCLDDVPAARNIFWASLIRAGAKVYLAGHDHFRDLSRIDDGDGNPDNDLYQYIVGTGGGPFPPAPGALNGSNAPYIPSSNAHAVENGYLLVEISGELVRDRVVTMTFKSRSCVSGGGTCSYIAASPAFQYIAPTKSP
jgi:Calcineurin-like phosphoesterase